MHSAAAYGWVRHRRFSPRVHDFRYRLSMLYLDLDEAEDLLRKHPLWSYQRRNVACVLRRDHLRGGADDLASAVRDQIEAFSGERPQGPIRLLTQPRYFGCQGLIGRESFCHLYLRCEPRLRGTDELQRKTSGRWWWRGPLASS